MSEWLDIESVPVNERKNVLLYGPAIKQFGIEQMVAVGYVFRNFDITRNKQITVFRFPFMSFNYGGATDYCCVVESGVTHWMPIPEPPK